MKRTTEEETRKTPMRRCSLIVDEELGDILEKNNLDPETAQRFREFAMKRMTTTRKKRNQQQKKIKTPTKKYSLSIDEIIIGILEEIEEEAFQKFKEDFARRVVNAIRIVYSENTTPEKLKFEDENFSVDSTGWTKIISPNGVAVLESLEKDAWEYLKCDAVPDKLVGQQLFTQDSAIIRVIKVGKRLPTDEEFTRLLKTKNNIPNLVLAGCREPGGSFYNCGSFAVIWSSLGSDSIAWSRSLSSGFATFYPSVYGELYGFSVRCVSRTD